jgi:hypothetical protein
LKRLSVVGLVAAVFAAPARRVEPAPAVKLRLMNETPFSLESLKGSVVVLLVFSLTLETCATARRNTTLSLRDRDA